MNTPGNNTSFAGASAGSSENPILAQGPIPGTAAMQANWKRMIGMAKSTWLRIGDADLVEADGNPTALIALVQRTYAISRDDANLQVRRFFEKNKA